MRSRLRSFDQIQDVTQETFVRVLNTIRSSGVKPQALGGFGIGLQRVLFEIFFRSQSRFTTPPEERAGDDPQAEDALVDEEERREVRHVISGLPEKDRTILRWLFFEERDKDDVCRALKVDREYLRVLLHLAKLRFRDDYLRRTATKYRPATPMG